MWRFVCCFISLSALAAPKPGLKVSAKPPPVVLMIRSATTPEGKAQERKLFDELGFALDGFMLLDQEAEAKNFAKLPLPEQIVAVLPEAGRNDAMVVVWLSFPLANQVMLHLISLGSGRALIRTIETDRSPVTASTLALITRELLGTAYLFDAPTSLPAEVSEIVRSVKKQIPVEVEVAPPPAPSRAWSVWAGLQSGFPLVGAQAPVPVITLGVGASLALPSQLELSFGVRGSYGNVSRVGAQFFTGGVGVSLFRGFALNRALLLGPFVGAAFTYGSYRSATDSVGVATPDFDVGARLRTTPSAGPGLVVTVAARVTPIRAALVTGDQLLYQTPLVEFVLGCALDLGL